LFLIRRTACASIPLALPRLGNDGITVTDLLKADLKAARDHIQELQKQRIEDYAIERKPFEEFSEQTIANVKDQVDASSPPLMVFPSSVKETWCPHGSERDEALRRQPPSYLVDVGVHRTTATCTCPLLNLSELHDSEACTLHYLNLSLSCIIGAFDGADAIQFARGGHQVLSLEASPGKADAIRQRLRDEGLLADDVPTFGEVEFYPYAAGERDGKTNFVVHKTLEQDEGDANFMGDNMGSQQDALGVPWTEGTHNVSVPIRRLDTLVPSDKTVLFMKIDAQGYDYKVLQGAERLLAEHRVKVLQIEFAVGLMPEKSKTAIALLQLMQRHGYRCVSCGDDPTQGKGSPDVPIFAEDFVRQIAEVKFMHRGVNHGGWDDIVCY